MMLRTEFIRKWNQLSRLRGYSLPCMPHIRRTIRGYQRLKYR
jgi:hypothetical protein